MPFTCPRQELRMIHTVTHYSLLDHGFRDNGRLVSRGVCGNNRFFTEHVIQQSEARIAHTDKLVVSKRWNAEGKNTLAFMLCFLLNPCLITFELIANDFAVLLQTTDKF